MDIRVLNYFVTIVQTKSISNAANTLHLTQPTLSRQIKELEEELDTILFHRGSREIQLTEDGQYLYNRAIEILSLVHKTESNIRRNDDISGEIYIGAAESQSLDVVAKAIQQLTSQYLSTSVHIRSGNADRVQEELNHGLVDFGITIGGYDSRKYDAISIPNRDRWGVLVPKDHPLMSLDKLQLSDIIHYPLIVSAQTSVDPTIFAGLGDYRIVGTYNLFYNASLLVKAGVGIALTLDGLADTSYEDSQLKFLYLDSNNPDTIQIIWKKQTTLSPVAKKFLALLEAEIDALR